MALVSLPYTGGVEPARVCHDVVASPSKITADSEIVTAESILTLGAPTCCSGAALCRMLESCPGGFHHRYANAAGTQRRSNSPVDRDRDLQSHIASSAHDAGRNRYGCVDSSAPSVATVSDTAWSRQLRPEQRRFRPGEWLAITGPVMYSSYVLLWRAARPTRQRDRVPVARAADWPD